jgi:hypothetical protein
MKLTLEDYKKYVDEEMTNEDFLKDRMETWTLEDFENYFGEEEADVELTYNEEQ